MLIIQIDKYTLQLAEVSYNGKKTLINKMRLFRLPENLENGGCSKDTAASADFVSNCIERGRLAKGKALLFLDDSSVMRKEYTHENSKPAHLLSLACLEADAILPENEGSFIIENEWYGPRKNREGLQTSVIYAANEDLVSGLTKHLKKRGILLKAVFPSALAHTDLIRSLLNPMISGKEFADRTVVSVCFSDQEMRIAVFHNGELIHQRIDEQSMQDFYRNVALAYHIPQTETESFCLKNGFNRNADINRINADAYERMEEAAESMLLKFVRSINIILNSEGLNLDHIIISGTPSAFPGFAEFISKCLKVDCSVIDEYSQRLSPIVELGDELKNRSNLFHKLVLLRGADYKKNKELNFLTRGIKAKRLRQRTVLVCTLIFIAMVIVMSILPLSYHITNQDYNRNIAALESPEYVEMQNILQEHRSIMNRVAEINEERDKLPFGDSIVSKHLRIIQTDLLSGCTINSMEYEGETDTFNLVVSAKNFDSFLSAKNKLDDREEYRVSFPINITEDEGIWTCELSIAVLTAETQEGMQEGE